MFEVLKIEFGWRCTCGSCRYKEIVLKLRGKESICGEVCLRFFFKIEGLGRWEENFVNVFLWKLR